MDTSGTPVRSLTSIAKEINKPLMTIHNSIERYKKCGGDYIDKREVFNCGRANIAIFDTNRQLMNDFDSEDTVVNKVKAFLLKRNMPDGPWYQMPNEEQCERIIKISGGLFKVTPDFVKRAKQSVEAEIR
jgi:hypothetical protein